MLEKSIFESKYMYQLHLFSTTLHQERWNATIESNEVTQLIC